MDAAVAVVSGHCEADGLTAMRGDVLPAAMLMHLPTMFICAGHHGHRDDEE